MTQKWYIDIESTDPGLPIFVTQSLLHEVILQLDIPKGGYLVLLSPSIHIGQRSTVSDTIYNSMKLHDFVPEFYKFKSWLFIKDEPELNYFKLLFGEYIDYVRKVCVR